MKAATATATTMGEVAAAAGVAVQTLYTSCPGGKPGLAKVVYDVTLAGDAQPLPQHARPEVAAIVEEPDPVRKLTRYAGMALGIIRRVGPVHRVLRSAAAATPADGGLRDLVAETERQRHAGARGLAEHLAAAGLLRPGLTAGRAADEIYALTSLETYDQLTGVCGWTDDDYREWLTRTLAATLLG